MGLCKVEGCETKARAKRLCKKHHTRWLRHGDVHTVKTGGVPVGSQYGANNPNWRGHDVTYLGAHERVHREFGKASDRSCVECGSDAKEWAYNHKDPNELTGNWRGFTVSYSADPRYYDPMCISCHRTLDVNRKVLC